MRLCGLLLALLLLVSPVAARQLSPDGGSGAAPGPEARAMWVVRYSLVSPAQVHAVVERAARYHFNALMVQVRGRGDAFYHSSIEPRAEALAGQPEEFDPLAQMIQEAHARGIQVYAWMDMMLVWSGKEPPRSSNHVVNTHPDWIDSRYDGSVMTSSDEEGQFLNPGLPAAQSYTVAICRDLVRNYDVDGVHLDYIRYPSASLGYNHECLQRFYHSLHPDETDVPEWRLRASTHAEGRAWTAWRQQQVTDLVAQIRAAIQTEKPWVSLSAAVWANLDDARYNRLQDWPTWLERGLVDFVCPMAYSTSTARVSSQIQQALAVAHGRQIWAGLGAWQMSSASTCDKIRAVRQLGVAGICLFSYDGMTDGGSSSSYLDALSRTAFGEIASCPAMSWLPGRSTRTALRSEAAGAP